MYIVMKGEHKQGCYAVKNYESGTWNTKWCVLEKPVSLDRNAKKHRHGSTPWLKVRCNCTGCKAEAYILLDDILEEVDEAE